MLNISLLVHPNYYCSVVANYAQRGVDDDTFFFSFSSLCQGAAAGLSGVGAGDGFSGGGAAAAGVGAGSGGVSLIPSSS